MSTRPSPLGFVVTFFAAAGGCSSETSPAATGSEMTTTGATSAPTSGSSAATNPTPGAGTTSSGATSFSSTPGPVTTSGESLTTTAGSTVTSATSAPSSANSNESGSDGPATEPSETAGQTASETGQSVNSGPATEASGGQDMPLSGGCGKAPTLTNSPPGANFAQNTVTVGNTSRQFIVRWPADYDNTHPYRLILGLHGAGGSGGDIAGDYFGLWDLAEGSTIFVALSADGGLWSAQNDLLYVDAVLQQLDAELCFDTSRVMLEGFSQGAAMAWTLTCSRPGVFRAVVGHSGGGVTAPQNCQPVPYLGSLGLGEGGNSQVTQTDRFAAWNGCTVETLPTAPTGGHVCTPYPGCPEDKPVVWCSFDGGHTPSPTDAGQRASWMPERAWQFFSGF